MGYKENSTSNEQIEEMIDSLIDYSYSLIDCKGSYLILDKIQLNREDNLVTLGKNILEFQSKDIIDLLEKQNKVALLTVTIGDSLEAKVKELFNQGEFTKATILDAIASVAAEEVANELNAIIAKESITKGLPHLTMRFSPGYGDLKLDIQPKILELLDGDKLGIATTTSNILLPEKSITAIIGLGKVENSYRVRCDFHCASCEFDNCVYN